MPFHVNSRSKLKAFEGDNGPAAQKPAPARRYAAGPDRRAAMGWIVAGVIGEPVSWLVKPELPIPGRPTYKLDEGVDENRCRSRRKSSTSRKRLSTACASRAGSRSAWKSSRSEPGGVIDARINHHQATLAPPPSP